MPDTIEELLRELEIIAATSTTKTMLEKLADAIEAKDEKTEAELRGAIIAYVIYRRITANGSRLTATYSTQDGHPSCQITTRRSDA